MTFVVRVRPQKRSLLGATTHVDGLWASRQMVLEP
jgi:hypothetical protein